MKLMRVEDGAGRRLLVIDRGDHLEEARGDLASGFLGTGRRVESARVLAPLDPVAILGVGLNFRAHAAETGRPPPEQPLIFAKLPTCAVGPGVPVVIPRHLRSDEVDAEAELAVVIGKPARNVSRARAHEHIAGYTAANDVSARDWQFRLGAGQFTRGKMFATFCPLGPCLVTPDSFDPARGPWLRGFHNGNLVQESRLDDLLFDVPTLVEFLSGSTDLPTGTVILTGTPSGVGYTAKPPRFLRPGDVTEVEIEGLGRLVNPVVEER